MAVKCGRGPHMHNTADDVRRCYNGDTDVIELPVNGPTETVVADELPATEKQSKFVISLAQQRLTGDVLEQELADVERGRWGRRSISQEIQRLKAMPKLPAEFRDNGRTFIPPGEDGAATLGGYHIKNPTETTGDGQTAVDLEAGMYRLDGVVYKVQLAVHGSGHPYAKSLVELNECAVCGDQYDDEHFSLTEHEFKPTFKFQYHAGAIRKLRPEHRMTLEEAKEFGKLYGTCCVCGRTLTNETSIEEGIGPVCGGRV